MGVLIDTCIWIDVEHGRWSPSEIAALTGERPVYLSPVTLAGLRLAVESAPDPGIRQKRSRTGRTMTHKLVVPIDAGTAEVFGELAAHFANGPKRRYRARIPDLWIASRAVQHGLDVPTRNGRDIRDIPGVDLIEIRPVSRVPES